MPSSHATPQPQSTRRSASSAASWLSLVAATTAGLGPSATLRTMIRADVSDHADGLRLVVHSYLPGQLANGTLPNASQKPVASSQRAVTADELRRGVVVDMVQPASNGEHAAKPMVMAWVERGRPNLDYDARLARPLPGVPRGCARSRGSNADLSASVLLQAS